jgi:hypothetical protein
VVIKIISIFLLYSSAKELQKLRYMVKQTAKGEQGTAKGKGCL